MDNKIKDIIRQKIAQTTMKDKSLIIEKGSTEMRAFLTAAKLTRFDAEINQVVLNQDKKMIEVSINKEIRLTEGDLKDILSANLKLMFLSLKGNMYFEFPNNFYDDYLNKLSK